MDEPQAIVAIEAGGEDASAEVSAEREAEKRRQQFERLNAFGESLAKTRSEAIAGRQQSDIEAEWLEDDEFYEGIDDANRAEFRAATWRKKPPGQVGQQPVGTTRSTVFPNITGPYVDAAAARIADMLLPTDDRAWGLTPTPIADLVSLAKGKAPKQMLAAAAARNPGRPDVAKQELAQAVEKAVSELREAKEKADKAQTRIEDWHVECQYHAHVRSVIEDAARIGTGILKGPVPVVRKRTAFAGGALVIQEKLAPASRCIDPWNFYPDPACGESIHNGSYTWEKDSLTRKQLRELMAQDGYIPEQIEECLREGPMRATAEDKPTPMLPTNAKANLFEVWYFHGTAERDDLEAAGCECGEEADPHVPCMVTMVNSRVIRASLNPLDTGEYPYDVMVWRKRSGHWAGIGVARQIRTAQRIVTAATRNLMDNAGIAAGPMLVFRQGVVSPAEGPAAIAPRKIWYIAADADEMVDATKAIGIIKVDMLVAELMQIIQLGLKLAEDVTGLPMILQGQQGKAPDTVGGLQLLNNNASAVLRRLARLFDDRVTEPHVRRYYAYLLQYGEDDDEKGDFSIDARGSSALVERDLQNQQIPQILQASLNPVFKLDPAKTAREHLMALKLDPSRFEFDDEKWQQIVENMAKGPQDPRLAVAQMRAEVDQRLKAMDQAFEAGEAAKDRELDVLLATMDAEISTAGLSVEAKKALDAVRARLGETVIKTRAQRQMQREANAIELSRPPTEPAGRAENGKAYIQ